jgi:hypothetical protein
MIELNIIWVHGAKLEPVWEVISQSLSKDRVQPGRRGVSVD